MRTKHALTAADAAAIITAAKTEAAKNQWNVSIAVVDDAGFLLHLERMDGAGLQSPEVALLKAKSAALGKTPTRNLETVAKDRPGTLLFPGRLPVIGGVPLLYQGQCVGGVGVSGVTSDQDEVVAIAGAAVLATA